MLHWTLPSSNLVEIRYAEIENNIFYFSFMSANFRKLLMSWRTFMFKQP